MESAERVAIGDGMNDPVLMGDAVIFLVWVAITFIAFVIYLIMEAVNQ